MIVDSADWDLLTRAKPAAAAGVLVILWSAEALAPMFTHHTRRLSHGAANLGLGAVNAVVAGVLFSGTMLAATEWAWRQQFGLLHWSAPVLPVWVQWVIGLLLLDAWMYAWHVMNHKLPWLWRFHAVHHSDREMDATSAVRFHTGEIALSHSARLVVLPLIGLTMPQLLLYETILLPVILFHHSNIRLTGRVDRVLRGLIVTPWMHWVHHSRWQPETDSNFASVLSVWDRIFGTFRLREDPSTIHLGLDDDETEPQWRSLSGMLSRPFRSPKREDPGIRD